MTARFNKEIISSALPIYQEIQFRIDEITSIKLLVIGGKRKHNERKEEGNFIEKRQESE